MEEMKNERNIDDKKTNVITVKLTAEKHKGVREAQHEWAGPAASQPMQPPAAHSAAGPVPARLRLAPAPRARSRTSFRHGGRRFGALAASMAALSALAVLLPALLAGRAPAPAAQVPDAAAAAAAQANSAAPQQGAAGGAGRLAPAEASPADDTQVRVYLTRTRTVETLPLEQYVTGVLAAEMPADFDLDALKAQAIAARTYIISRLQSKNTSGVPNGKADVVDSVDHQAYLSQAELKKWAQQGKEAQLEKLQKAVADTKGIIMTYKGKPITAAFFSASGGYTENSEDYWNLKVPYLRSVSSPWDAKMNPKNQVTVTLSLEEVFEKLGQQIPAEPAINNKEASRKTFQMISTTPGGRVNEIRIGDKVYTGREVREKLGLRSSQFTIKASNSEVKITTYGSGHGVGMSQWGANGMAKEGYTTTQILKHYYTGISFQQAGQ
ncbi:stage II sporulation protein D [Fontibacillus panacisegetis]|uniref:Stage II sporulation protein D n=1 Tax=Fontibacillus panacisegetis TaxID=670482 RepID=A0A1G7PNF2_9BACL|nr:stage II sporulation protein D [Fontibacillus panacisegetis]SDF87726.1 stage II sporulation protein D [Fontibacillus panacisegetis]